MRDDGSVDWNLAEIVVRLLKMESNAQILKI